MNMFGNNLFGNNLSGNNLLGGGGGPATPPVTISLLGASSVVEGIAYQLTLSTVTGAGTVTGYVVHWGDGAIDTYTTNGVKTHIYTGAAVETITVDVVDENGTHISAGTKSVTVISAGPGGPVTISLSGDSTVEEDVAYQLTLGAVAGASAVTGYTVHWGDGAVNTYATLGVKSHVYADPGDIVITVDVTDVNGVHADAGTKLLTVSLVEIESPCDYSYATRSDIETIFGRTNVLKWSDVNNDSDANDVARRINWALCLATAHLDDRLRGSPFPAPFTTPYQMQLIDACARYAGVLLYESRGAVDYNPINGEPMHYLAMHRKLVQQFVVAVWMGKIRLGGESEATQTPQAVESSVSDILVPQFSDVLHPLTRWSQG